MTATTQPLTFSEFKAEVRRLGLSLTELRGNWPPSPEKSALIDACGLENYGRFVTRYEREQCMAGSLFGDYPRRLG